MKLYFLLNEHRYVHRQSDIPKGAPHEVREIPTDLAGLMAKLNDFEADRQLEREFIRNGSKVLDHAAPGEVLLTAPEPCTLGQIAEVTQVFIDDKPIEVELPRPMDAGAILSRIDSPGVNVEGVVEAIGKAKGYALRRYAGAVAVRFQELEKF